MVYWKQAEYKRGSKMRTIKKIIKKTIGVLFLVLLIIGGVIGYKGYERYKEVLEKVPLQERIAEIRQKPSYTEIEDLPQIYLDAVVAVEDKRFYHHPGIRSDFYRAGGPE